MSETQANLNQGTPSAADLDAAIAADEANRVTIVEEVPVEPVPQVDPEPEHAPESPEQAPEGETEFEKRISRLAYEKRQAEKQLRDMQARLERAEGNAPPLPREEQDRQEVERRAAELAALKLFNDRANAIYQDGVKAYPDFEQKISALRDMGAVSMPLVEACDEVGDPHKLIYWLAKNPDEAERISNLPGHKMGAALAKVATKLAAPPPQSKAPAPIRPITGNAGVNEDWTTMPIEQYMRQEDERWSQRRRR